MGWGGQKNLEMPKEMIRFLFCGFPKEEMFASKGKVLELKRKCIGGSDYSRICRSRLENFPTTINKLSGRAYKQESNQGL